MDKNMKKYLKYVLMAVLVMSMCALCACGGSDKTAAQEPAGQESAEQDPAGEEGGTMTLAGGWTVADVSAAELPEELQTAFDKALETLTGSYNEVTPIAYIGRQVVSGTNYAVLCRVTFADEEAPAGLIVLTAYADLQGNAELLSTVDFNIEDYNLGEEAGAEENSEILSGGWQTPEEITSSAIPEEAKIAFDKAMEGFTGNELTPMALLGTQVVSGTNYAILCRSKLVTAEPVESIQVVIVYSDTDGNASVTGIKTVDVASYVNN
jgi:hypothetical protein